MFKRFYNWFFGIKKPSRIDDAYNEHIYAACIAECFRTGKTVIGSIDDNDNIKIEIIE